MRLKKATGEEKQEEKKCKKKNKKNMKCLICLDFKGSDDSLSCDDKFTLVYLNICSFVHIHVVEAVTLGSFCSNFNL